MHVERLVAAAKPYEAVSREGRPTGVEDEGGDQLGSNDVRSVDKTFFETLEVLGMKNVGEVVKFEDLPDVSSESKEMFWETRPIYKFVLSKSVSIYVGCPGSDKKYVPVAFNIAGKCYYDHDYDVSLIPEEVIKLSNGLVKLHVPEQE